MWHPHLKKKFKNLNEFDIVDSRKQFPAFLQVEDQMMFLKNENDNKKKMQCSCRFIMEDTNKKKFRSDPEIKNQINSKFPFQFAASAHAPVQAPTPAPSPIPARISLIQKRNELSKKFGKYRFNQQPVSDPNSNIENFISEENKFNSDPNSTTATTMKDIIEKLNKLTVGNTESMGSSDINNPARNLLQNDLYRKKDLNMNTNNVFLPTPPGINLQQPFNGLNNPNINLQQQFNPLSNPPINYQNLINYLEINSLMMKNLENVLLNQQNLQSPNSYSPFNSLNTNKQNLNYNPLSLLNRIPNNSNQLNQLNQLNQFNNPFSSNFPQIQSPNQIQPKINNEDSSISDFNKLAEIFKINNQNNLGFKLPFQGYQ